MSDDQILRTWMLRGVVTALKDLLDVLQDLLNAEPKNPPDAIETALVRLDALEEAAQCAEQYYDAGDLMSPAESVHKKRDAEQIASRIRRLKEPQ